MLGASDNVRSDGSESDYYHTASPASADYDVSADLKVTSNNNYAGVMGRVATGATTWYGAGYDSGSTRYEYFKAVAGSFTTLGTSSATLTVGNTYNVKLTMSGTTIGVVAPGWTPSTTDSAISAAGKAGLYTASGAGNGYYVDNLVGTDAGGGGTPAVKELALLGVG